MRQGRVYKAEREIIIGEQKFFFFFKKKTGLSRSLSSAYVQIALSAIFLVPWNPSAGLVLRCVQFLAQSWSISGRPSAVNYAGGYIGDFEAIPEH